jgi:CubicO group peptidase (beta-lactamase class C family)
MHNKKKGFGSWVFIAGFAVQTAALSQPAAVNPSPSTPSTTPPAITPSAHALSSADLEAWLDGYFPNALNAGDIAGGVVAVVKDGQVLLEKGYGFADFEKRVPVDPKATLFRWGSVSKLFTWTAVMQLVEQGKIDLDADVNQYLDFKIPPRDGKPISMRNIMTHTAGFEERLKGITWDPADGDLPLDRYLKEYIPARIYAPGGTPAYSNYAAALAGYIVSRVSGVSFDDYVDKQLLEPLAMHNATFRQPLPESFKAHMSRGYQSASFEPKDFELVGPAPAGSLSAPAEDLTHFMIAHLQNGRYGSGQILKPETAEQMHSSALTILPRMDRMLLGFYEDTYDGRRVIAHGGDTQWFHSDLHLYLDDGVGLLASVNSLGKGGAAHEILSTLFHDFTDRYLPGPTPDGKVDDKTAGEHARMIAGRYRVSRRVDSSFVSLLYATQQTTVDDNGDGTISVSSETSPSGMPLKWREIEPFIWREEHAKTLLSAHVEGGRVVRFGYGDSAAIEVYDRTPWQKSSGWWVPAAGTAVAVLLLSALAWPISALVRRRYGAAYPLSGIDARAHRWVRIAALSSSLVFLAWFVLLVAMISALGLIPKLGGVIGVLLVLSPIAFLGGAAAGVWNLWIVSKSGRSRWAKLWAIVLAAALLILLWAALSFHLIAFKTGF